MSLIAFRRSDGTQLWEAFAPDGRTGRAHYKNGHASATPSTDGTLVYASFGSRGLAAFDFNGKLVWHKDLGDVDNYHGAAGSPLLYKNRIILYQDFDGGSFVAAFDASTGKELWRTPRRAFVGWGTPVAVTRWHARRDHRQQPVIGHRVRSGHRPRAVGLRWQLVRSDSDAGGRPRPRVRRHQGASVRRSRFGPAAAAT